MAKDRVTRQKYSYKALVTAVEPKKPKEVVYIFSNGRKFMEKQR